MTIEAHPGIRMAIGSHRPLLDCRNAPRLLLDDTDLAKCHIHAEDQQRARHLLADQAVRSAFGQLLAELSDTNSWEVYIQPERVWARIRVYRLDEEMVVRWLDALALLAAACEKASS